MKGQNKLHILAGGGIVYRLRDEKKEPEVLLIHRNGVWDLPKGKAEKRESIEMTAVREVAEEVGSRIPSIVSKIGSSYHEYDEKDTCFGKTTHWYSMIFTAEENLHPQQEEGIEKIEWVPLSQAIERVGYETLKNILQDFQQQKKV